MITKELLQRVLSEAKWMVGFSQEMIKEMESALDAWTDEPVAWLVLSVGRDGSYSVEHAAAWKEAAHEHINDAITEFDIDGAGKWIVRPAYTHPAPRQPLSDKQIAEAWVSISDPITLGAALQVHSGKAVREFARAIERAHGIGGEA